MLNFDPEASDLDGLVVGCPLCGRERGRVYVYTHTGNVSNPVSHTHTYEHTHTHTHTHTDTRTCTHEYMHIRNLHFSALPWPHLTCTHPHTLKPHTVHGVSGQGSLHQQGEVWMASMVVTREGVWSTCIGEVPPVLWLMIFRYNIR